MKALVFEGPGQKSWEDVPDPKIQKATDVIVKMAATAICGTDLHILKGDVPEVKVGRVLGHAGIGVITQVGDSVTQLKVGDRVHPQLHQRLRALLVLSPGPLQPLPRPRRHGGHRLDLRLHDRRHPG